ncbi:MAG: hypothetical protein JOY90_01260 [Bradyrhizobium sp.]|uniref:hypothetical protein n=1 Tax=Bradyrhizobium sp. TaxID=376 RepID=UPI001DCCF759|nr:hypothetical protein [Bradyrhizobium sp.]MBV9559082.1 hypothetical protein [Bradyrhizobium sp.]
MAAPDSATTSKRRRTCLEGRRGPTRQTELFGDERSGAMVDTPAWQDLPATTQAALTSLIARLLLTHAERHSAGPRAEAGHDR